MGNPETMYGCELHRPASQTSSPAQFLKMIQVDKLLYFREGDVGEDGALIIKDFPTVHAAEDAAHQWVRRKITKDHFTVVHADHLPFTRVAGFGDPTGAEQAFADHWDALPTSTTPAPGPIWAIVSGAQNPWPPPPRGDSSAKDILATLKAGPHAVDPTEDHIIGQLPRLGDTSAPGAPLSLLLDTQSSSMSASWITTVDPSCTHSAPACEECSQRMADLLAYLCRGVQVRRLSLTARDRLADTARRLMRAHAEPTPV